MDTTWAKREKAGSRPLKESRVAETDRRGALQGGG